MILVMAARTTGEEKGRKRKENRNERRGLLSFNGWTDEQEGRQRLVSSGLLLLELDCSVLTQHFLFGKFRVYVRICIGLCRCLPNCDYIQDFICFVEA